MAHGEERCHSVSALATDQEMHDHVMEIQDLNENERKDDSENKSLGQNTDSFPPEIYLASNNCNGNDINSQGSLDVSLRTKWAQNPLKSGNKQVGNLKEKVEDVNDIQTSNESEKGYLLRDEKGNMNAISMNSIKNSEKNVDDIKDAEKENHCQIPEVNTTIRSEEHSKLPINTISNDVKKTLQSTDGVELDEDTVCGIGSFRPQWLQAWATPRCYLVLYSIIGVLQGSYYTYFIGVMSTLEKRFAFKSKISGTIMMVDEITPLFLGVLIGYFGGKAHRPRLLAIGMFLASVCCFLSALPYFMYGTAQHLVSGVVKNGTGPEVCDFQLKKEECEEDDRPPTVSAVIIFLMGSFLKGFGNLAYYAIGLTYLDDNTKKKNTPIYFALTTSFRLLGPTLGFLMSSTFLKYYENPFVDPGFSNEDPRWVGAWWMGFVLQGTLLLIFTSPIVLFPRRLPSVTKSQVFDTPQETICEKFRGLFIGLKRLGKNPLYICMCCQTIFGVIGGIGHYMMLPKYMESQFRLNSSDASLYAGPPGLIAIQVVTILGGVAIWKFRPGPRKLIAGIIFTESIATIGYLSLMIPSCGILNVAGATKTDQGLELANECNRDCLCTTNVFTPVCGPDGHSNYFSPCYAGCTAILKNGADTESFQNCSCIQNTTGRFEFTNNVMQGRCRTKECWFQAMIYLILMPSMYGITSIFRVAYTMVLLRSVSPADKSFALGTFESLHCIFALLPCPIIYGALVDSTCLVWEKSCGKTGNCWLYDNDKFRKLLHGVSAAFVFTSDIFTIGMFFLSSRLKNLYDDEEYIQEMSIKGEMNNPNNSGAINERVTSKSQ